MKIAIVIATYCRSDGKTPSYLIRALRSIEAQTHKDYAVYVIGDNYASHEEFFDICKLFPFVKAYNIPVAPERELYPKGDYRLFCSGGVGASKRGILHALYDGYEYVCHLDHDDYWSAKHLELINGVIEERKPMFVCTLSTYAHSHLPKIMETNSVLPFYPVPFGMVCSSACIKYADTTLRARDVFAETGQSVPSDADLWQRLSDEMKERGKDGYVIATKSCHHEEEGYSKQSKI